MAEEYPHALDLGFKIDGDGLDWHARALAGPMAKDCGRVPIYGDISMAVRCVFEEEAKGRPFRVRFDLQGIDADVAAAFVRTPVGRRYELHFVGTMTGRGGTSLFGQRVWEKVCQEGVVPRVYEHSHLVCTDPRESMGRVVALWPDQN